MITLNAIAPNVGLLALMLPTTCDPCQRCRSHAIVSTSTGPEYYVSVLSIVDKGQLEPGCTVLLHNKVLSERSMVMLT